MMDVVFLFLVVIILFVIFRHVESKNESRYSRRKARIAAKKRKRTIVITKKESGISAQEREPEITPDIKGDTCPYCFQSIDSNAVVCKYCGRALFDPTDIGFQKELQTQIQEPINQTVTPAIASQEATSIHTPLAPIGESNIFVDILLWVVFHMFAFIFIGVFLYPDVWFPEVELVGVLEKFSYVLWNIAAFGGGVFIIIYRWFLLKHLFPQIRWFDLVFSGVIATVIGMFINFSSFLALGNVPTEKEYLISIIFLVVGTVIFLSIFQALIIRKYNIDKSLNWAFKTSIYFILTFVLIGRLIYNWSNDWTTQIVLSTILILFATGLSGWDFFRTFRSPEGIESVQEKSSPMFFTSNMKKAELEGKNLSGANLDGVDFSFANLQKANLTDASLEPIFVNRKFRLIDLGLLILFIILGADGDSESRKEWRPANLSDADLTGAILENTKMSEALLKRTILVQAKMKNAFLQEAVLMDADLRGADLSYANLRNVLFCGANLEGAILQNAILEGADFEKANLSGADLRNVDFTGVKFDRANLDGVILPDGYEISNDDFDKITD